MADQDPAPASNPLAAAKTIARNTITAGFVAGTAGSSVDVVQGCLLDIAKWGGFTFDHPGAWAAAIVGLAGYVFHITAKKESTS